MGLTLATTGLFDGRGQGCPREVGVLNSSDRCWRVMWHINSGNGALYIRLRSREKDSQGGQARIESPRQVVGMPRRGCNVYPNVGLARLDKHAPMRPHTLGSRSQVLPSTASVTWAVKDKVGTWEWFEKMSSLRYRHVHQQLVGKKSNFTTLSGCQGMP